MTTSPVRVLQERLVDHVGALETAQAAIGTGGREGVHDTRVACRNLRADLATFGPLLSRGAAPAVGADLRWLARVLSGVRDLEVVRERLLELVDHEPVDLVAGPVRARIAAVLADALAAAQTDVTAALASERHGRLLETLRGWRTAAPVAVGAADVTACDLAPVLQREWARVSRRGDLVETAADRDRALHAVRRAAKRLRYTAEAGLPLWGEEARRYARTGRRIAEALGAHQDTVVCRTRLVELAGLAHAAGESTFTYGRLHAREEDRADASDREFARLWLRARRRFG